MNSRRSLEFDLEQQIRKTLQSPAGRSSSVIVTAPVNRKTSGGSTKSAKIAIRNETKIALSSVGNMRRRRVAGPMRVSGGDAAIVDIEISALELA